MSKLIAVLLVLCSYGAAAAIDPSPPPQTEMYLVSSDALQIIENKLAQDKAEIEALQRQVRRLMEQLKSKECL